MFWKAYRKKLVFFGVFAIIGLVSVMRNSSVKNEFGKIVGFLLLSPASGVNAMPKLWNLPDDNPSYFVPREHKLTPLDFQFTIASDICKQTSPYLLILILSMASHVEYRKAIRETWASVAYNKPWPGEVITQSVKLVFLFGNSNSQADAKILKAEAVRTRDIVQASFTENYFNLTYKVLAGFKWVREHCSGAKYVMKNDEDSFVHIPWLLERLQNHQQNNSIIGPYFENAGTIWKGKYGIDPDAYPFKTYPPHVKGNVYIMSKSTAMRLLEVAEFMPYVNMEDAHITGILAKTIRAKHAKIPRTLYDPFGKLNLCDIATRRKLAGRDVSASYARQIWETILNRKRCA